LLTLGVAVDLAELLLGQVAVIALELLLGAQLRAEVGHLALAALAMLAGAVFAAVHRGLRAAPDVLAHAAVDLVFCACTLGHGGLPLSFTISAAPPLPGLPGRQGPPCGVHGRQTYLPPQNGRPEPAL